jgi:putative lipoic acid-binding regulatory protein
MTTEEPKGLEFPCDFQIKAMGLDDGAFQEVVVSIIRRHCDSIRADSLRTRASSGGKYVSVTVVIEARSHEQLDAIYDDLTAHDKVLMRL